MRYAVTADLHGRRKSWRRVRAAAAAAGVDKLVVLGDYLDSQVPWRKHDPSMRREPDSVVKSDPELWRALSAEAVLVLGNQEWRIRDLLRPDQVPPALAPLLAAPERTDLGAATGIHGHQLRWHEARRGAGVIGLEPDPATLPAHDRLLFAGHSHRPQVLEVTWANWPDGPRPEAVRRIPVRPATPLDVSAFTGQQQEHQEQEHQEHREQGHQEQEPQSRWSTLFVNVGPAAGRPSHWLVYDDDRYEITFYEADSTSERS